MWNLLTPDQYYKNVYDIDFEYLIDIGIRGLVFDLDNTLVEWGDDVVSDELALKVEQLRQLGFRMCIVSNNLGGRVATMSEKLEIPAASGALKPLKWAYLRALALLQTSSSETALIGDQLFTDILGGNLAGMHTILVDPLAEREFPTTRIVRLFERLARKRLGLVHYSERQME